MVRHIDGAELPDWVLHASERVPTDARPSAVLMAFAHDGASPDVLLTSRSRSLRSHAGQPAFPGGGTEPGESAVMAALREAHEETGLDPRGVIPAAALPPLYLRPSGYVVTPILAYWCEPTPVWPVDPAETDRVVRVPVAELADPVNRGVVVVETRAGRLRSPAFAVDGLLVWGFTAGLLDVLIEWGGWAQRWDRGRIFELAALPARLQDRATP